MGEFAEIAKHFMCNRYWSSPNLNSSMCSKDRFGNLVLACYTVCVLSDDHYLLTLQRVGKGRLVTGVTQGCPLHMKQAMRRVT